MKNLLVAVCALIALGSSAAASDANQNRIVVAQAQDPDSRWNRDRDGDVRRFNREERGERREGEDRRGDRDGRRRDRDERGDRDRDRGRDRDRDWDRRRDGDRDRYEGRPRRQCFINEDGYRVCRD
jgi:hypothetical protein